MKSKGRCKYGNNFTFVTSGNLPHLGNKYNREARGEAITWGGCWGWLWDQFTLATLENCKNHYVINNTNIITFYWAWRQDWAWWEAEQPSGNRSRWQNCPGCGGPPVRHVDRYIDRYVLYRAFFNWPPFQCQNEKVLTSEPEQLFQKILQLKEALVGSWDFFIIVLKRGGLKKHPF